MNAAAGAVLVGGQPVPSPGGDFLPLVSGGGWALFFVCLLGFVVAAARLRHRDRPEKFTGLVLLGTMLGGTAGAVLGSVT